jgi:putative ABC transport system permease protein
VANLFLAEALGRRRELAIKAALGATRARLIRELLTESVLLGALGGALGLALAWSGLGAVVGLAPPDLTVWTANEIRIDGRILMLTAAMTLITGIVFGSLPAWRASRQEAGDILNARTASAGRATARLRSALVVIEVALSVLLLTGAALLVRSFLRLHELDPGFKPGGVLTVRLSLPTDRYPAAARRAFLEQVEQKLAAMPGIEAETIADGVPTSGGSLHFQELEAEAGVKETSESILPDASVSPSYFSTMGIPITAGRSFTEDDPATVAIVNDKLARRLWSDGKGIGRRFRLGSTNPWLTVVGIAGDVRGSRMVERETTAEMYSPFWRGIRADSGALRKAVGPRRSFFEALVIVRAAKGLALLDGIKRAVWSIDPSQPVGRAVLVKDLLADSLSEDRFAATLMGTFAALALLLAGAGLYAVLAQLVAHRWREIGIRMALGASAADTSRLIVSRGLLLSGAGVALGLAGAWAAARVLSSQLYGVRPHDPLTFSAVAVAVLTTALAASWVPVRRAVTIDPATVLRVE